VDWGINMAFSSSGDGASGGELISHFTGVRLRVNGTGSLQMRLISLDDQREQVLVPLAMNPLPGKEPLRLSNFNEQRAYLELKTTAIDEVMRVNRVIVFAKSLYTDYPNAV